MSPSPRWVDTLNFNIKKGNTNPGGTSTSTLRAVSIANIHGALGDNGQSHKTLTYLLDAVFGDVQHVPRVAHGCGGTA